MLWSRDHTLRTLNVGHQREIVTIIETGAETERDRSDGVNFNINMIALSGN